MSDLWHVNLAAWIIQDGNYGDFARGDECEFALEFWQETVDLCEPTKPRCAWVKESCYDVTASVAFCDSKVWVLDFGLLAFQEAKPPEGLTVGDFVTARIGLGVDPFFYFERLYKLPGIPPLIYSWTLQRILIQTAPFVDAVIPGTGKARIRDESKLGYREIDKTDAWHDDGGNGDYLLKCCYREVPPKRTSRSAT
jgi:hypothetical protein